jgi:hypothetical protein
VTIFWWKSSIILWKLAQMFFLSISKIKQCSILWSLWLQNKVWQLIFFHSSLLVLFLNPGSGIRDPRSGINIPDPQHWSQLGYCDLSDQWLCLLITFYFASGQLLLIFGKDRKVKQFFNWIFWPSIRGFPSVLWIRISNFVITDLVPDHSYLSKIQRNCILKVQYFIIFYV